MSQEREKEVSDTLIIQDLTLRLEEAQQMLSAIRNGEVDALVVKLGDVDRVFTLAGADHTYRLLVESMDEGALTLGEDGTIFYCNSRFAEMVQVPLEQIVGTALQRFVVTEDQGLLAALLERGMRMGGKGEVQLSTMDGTPLQVHVSISQVTISDTETMCIAIFTDVTELRQVQHHLQEANETLERRVRERTEELADTNRRLQLLNDAANRLLMRGDPKRFIRGIFEMFSKHFGLDVYFNYWVSEDGTRLELHSFGGIPEGEAAKIATLEFGQEVCGRAAQERRQIVAEDIQQSDNPVTAFVRSLGITTYACQPLQADGRLVGTLSFGTRTRPRFRSDELELMQTICNQVAVALDRARLFAAVRQREAELVERAEQLQEADRQKDVFLAMLAHELRNPLAPIRTAASILRHQSDAPTVQRTSEIIERQAAHLASLVEDLLDVSRITRGKISLKKVVVDLATVVLDTVESCRPLIKERGQNIQVSLHTQHSLLEGDPDRLEQILSNLLLNASKFTPYGGDIGISLDHGGDEIVIRVWDTGEGIAPDLLPHVFDLFTQGDRSLDRSKGGLGIGLSLVKGLVEGHGGSVEAHSEGLGQGSAFTLRLPALSTMGTPNVKSTDESVIHPTRSLRILLVEDNKDAAEMLLSLLDLLGHEVRSVEDGPSAVAVAAEYQPQVILMDIGLPGMDGYETAKRIRDRIGSLMVKLIALTGYGQDEDRVRSLEAGFEHHLVKPIDPDELERLLAEIV